MASHSEGWFPFSFSLTPSSFGGYCFLLEKEDREGKASRWVNATKRWMRFFIHGSYRWGGGPPPPFFSFFGPWGGGTNLPPHARVLPTSFRHAPLRCRTNNAHGS